MLVTLANDLNKYKAAPEFAYSGIHAVLVKPFDLETPLNTLISYHQQLQGYNPAKIECWLMTAINETIEVLQEVLECYNVLARNQFAHVEDWQNFDRSLCFLFFPVQD